MSDKTYKKKLWRIRKHKDGRYYVQSSRFGLFWENKKSCYAGYGLSSPSTIFYSSPVEAEEGARHYARKDEQDFYWFINLKKAARQSKKFVVDLGRLP